MSLSKEDVARIAHLARLAIPEDRLAPLATQLSGILTFVEQMNAVDTKNVEPLAHPQDLTARLREDVVTEPNLRSRYQSIAPAVDAGLYLVPKVIE